MLNLVSTKNFTKLQEAEEYCKIQNINVGKKMVCAVGVYTHKDQYYVDVFEHDYSINDMDRIITDIENFAEYHNLQYMEYYLYKYNNNVFWREYCIIVNNCTTT